MRRMNLKREDGVAMTEFALIVPVFLLIVAGLLAFGRVFFYWIEANHMASETARWAVVDRNPYAPVTLQQHAAQNSTTEFANDVQVCIDFPSGVVDLGEPVRVADPEAVQLRAHPRHRADHDPRLVDDAHRAPLEQRRPGELCHDHGPAQQRDVHVTLRLRDERGGVLVMAAVMIPVFLLLTALVVDVGNWYTHKRQLQNRADAAAFAAGVEYARNWKACVQTGDAALRASTGGQIADAARQYAGDPEAADYSTGSLPTPLRNTEIANQGNLDVVVNSNNPDYTDDTDYTDGGGSPPQGNPCFLHTTGDDISAAGPLDGRPRQGAQPPVALRRGRPAALAERRTRADRDPPRDQRPPVPAARRAEQRDHQGAGAVLQPVQ